MVPHSHPLILDLAEKSCGVKHSSLFYLGVNDEEKKLNDLIGVEQIGQRRKSSRTSSKHQHQRELDLLKRRHGTQNDDTQHNNKTQQNS
jgi:hypothetical protein